MLILRLRLQETQHKRRLNNRSRAKTIAFDLNDGQPQSSRHTQLFGTIRTLVNFHTRFSRRTSETREIPAKDAACLRRMRRICEVCRVLAKHAACLRRMAHICKACRVFAKDAAYPRRMPRVCQGCGVSAKDAARLRSTARICAPYPDSPKHRDAHPVRCNGWLCPGFGQPPA